MNFNIYLEDELGQKLEEIAQNTGQSRNALIREAVREILRKYNQMQWSEEILNFEGFPEDSIIFESYRDELSPPSQIGIFS